MEILLDLHPFTNASYYTVVETISLASAHILFLEVGFRHLLVIPKISIVRTPILSINLFHISLEDLFIQAFKNVITMNLICSMHW